nr:hypothetical protein [Sulfitobacter pontiacus]
MVARGGFALTKPVLVAGRDQNVINGDVWGGDVPLIPVAFHRIDARFMPN